MTLREAKVKGYGVGLPLGDRGKSAGTSRFLACVTGWENDDFSLRQ